MIYVVLSALLFLFGVALGSIFGTVWDFEVQWFLVFSFILLFKNWKFGILFLAFICGFLRTNMFLDFREDALGLAFKDGILDENGDLNTAELAGEVMSFSGETEDGQKFVIETKYGKVLLTVGSYEEIKEGDWLLVRGEFDLPSSNVNGFNYANYLAVSGIFLTGSAQQIQILNSNQFSVRRMFYFLKSEAIYKLRRLYHEPEAGFASGLILGSKQNIPEFLSEAFRRVGLSHIVVISGSNMSLVIYAISFLFIFLPFKKRIAVSAFAVTLFVIFVGASAAVLRAGLMGILGLLGLYMGRRSMAFFALLWSAVLMTVVSPFAIVFDSGFQLSFLSVLGLLCFGPIISGLFSKFWPEGKITIVREALVMTLSAQIAVMPLTIFSFGGISLVSPFTNVLAAPLVPFAMLFSALSIVFGEFAVAPAVFYLKSIEKIAIYFSVLPYSFYECEISLFLFAIFEFFLVLFTLIFYKPILVRAFFRSGAAKTSKVLSPLFGKRVKQ